MLLIERFYGYGKVIRSALGQIVSVVTLWAFGAMLLGMCYSRNMVRELTSPSLPPYPHDLKQLADVNEYPILTRSIVTNGNFMVPFFSLWIGEYLAE